MTTIILKNILTNDNLKAFFKHSSKFCSSCGKIYAEQWAQKLSSQLINQKHRHIIFTLPKEIWNYPIIKRDLLTTFSNHINTLFRNWFKKEKIRFLSC